MVATIIMPRWKVLKSQEVYRTGFFKLRVEECELPDRRVMPRYYVMDFPDWVNVVPVTEDGQLVLVEQYRHGAGEVFLEIPGGSSHGPTEDPMLAGQRELLEETGYQSGRWIYCGFHYPNPAMQSNKMHTYLALNCVKVAEPSLDPYEDLHVKLLPLGEGVDLLKRGEFKHSLIANSLAMALRFLPESFTVAHPDRR